MANDPLLEIIGPYAVGEMPEIFETTVTDENDQPVDLSGATLHCNWSVAGSPPAGIPVTIDDPVGGQISVAWPAAVFARPGLLSASIWALDNLRLIMVSKVKATIYTPDVPLISIDADGDPEGIDGGGADSSFGGDYDGGGA